MSIGFRKSLFGFNCQDVANYIELTHNSFAQKEKSLTENVSKLTDELNQSNEKYNNLLEEKEAIEKQLAEYTAKSDEIERLSENIGKLYLVAQTNAHTIMEHSKNSAEIVNEEVNKNIFTIEEAQTSLEDLRKNITKTSEEFVSEVEKLISSLADTKDQIISNTAQQESAEENFNEVYNSIVK